MTRKRSAISEVILGVLLTALVGIAGYMALSIQELNVNVAVVVTTLTHHQKILDKHAKEIEHLQEH